jgi:hypothetical protein
MSSLKSKQSDYSDKSNDHHEILLAIQRQKTSQQKRTVLQKAKSVGNGLVLEESDSEEQEEEHERTVFDPLAATENYVPSSVSRYTSSAYRPL